MKDEMYMKRVLTLAEKGMGRVNPNPLVGAVVVKNGEVIGEWYHERYGGPHAEKQALECCEKSPRNATLYVNLEPCCHYGKTPPCTEVIIEKGVARVVVGIRDPNPLVSGKGIAVLKKAGIEVTLGVMEEDCRKLNHIFLHYMTQKRPYVVMKYAMTMDGKIASVTGESRWITGEKARQRVHESRGRYRGIMVGAGTVLADDPMLDCRLEGGRDPIRILCDSRLRIPLDSRVITTAEKVRTIIATVTEDEAHHRPYLERGCEILIVEACEGRVDLAKLMRALYAREIDSILLEGGGTLNFSALKSRIVDAVHCYFSPKILGGGWARSPVEGEGFERLKEAVILKNARVSRWGEDILIESEVSETCLQV